MCESWTGVASASFNTPLLTTGKESFTATGKEIVRCLDIKKEYMRFFPIVSELYIWMFNFGHFTVQKKLESH